MIFYCCLICVFMFIVFGENSTQVLYPSKSVLSQARASLCSPHFSLCNVLFSQHVKVDFFEMNLIFKISSQNSENKIHDA